MEWHKGTQTIFDDLHNFNPKNETGLSQHADIDMSLRGHRGRWAGTTPALFPYCQWITSFDVACV